MTGSRYAMKWLAAAGMAALVASCGRGEASKDAPTPGQQIDAPAAAAPDAGPITTLTSRVESKNFRDWKVTCDNGATCAAIAPSVDEAQGWLSVEMAPETAAVPKVLVGVWLDNTDNTSRATPVTLTIDGRSFRTEPVTDADIPTARVVAADALNAVRALASGKVATARAAGETVPISLTGASASLLWIDDRQGRLDTPNALIRVGQRAASVQGPALPVITPAPAVAQGQLGGDNQILPKSIEILPAVRECRSENSGGGDVISAKLGPQQELWGVPCGSGAYNFTNNLYITGPNGQNPVAARLPQADGTTTNEVVNGFYNAEKRELVAFAKGRGIGDCGIAQTWVWTERSFALALEQSMDSCNGLPPDQWPISYRAKVQ